MTATAGANQAAVSWTAANGNGASITAYLVRAATGPDAGASIATSGGATSATLTGLAGGTAATVSVVAESSCGVGPAGTSAAVTPAGPATTYVGTVLGSAPVAFYRLAEPAGATVMADSSGNAADGSYAGQQTLGQAAALASDPASSAGYTSCCSGIGSGGPALPVFNSARSVQAWVNTSSGTTNQAVMGWGQTNSDQAFVVSVSPQSVNVDGFNDYLTFPTPRPVDDGHWHLITVTFDGTTVTAYLDDQEVGSAPFSEVLNTLDPAGLSVAAFFGYNLYDGDLADVAVYPSALTPATVAAQFAASGYSRPTVPRFVNAFFGGTNAADVTWVRPTGGGGVTSYLASALGGQGSPSVAVPADATAARLTGLAAGTYTFRVVAMNAYGDSPAATTKPFSVTGSASTYVSATLSSSPSVFYRLDDSIPNVMADSSGNAATGSYTPQSTLGQTGPLGNDAATSIADNARGPAAGSYPSLPQYAQPRTLESWINTTDGGEDLLASYGALATSQGFWVAVEPHEVIVSGVGDDLTFTSTASLNDGSWHFLAVTATSGSATVYVDGSSLGSQNFPIALDTLPGPQGLQIGTGAQGCCGTFHGDLADVAIFPSALTAAKVAVQFAASGLAPPPAPGSPGATAGTNQATVSWQAPSGADPAVIGYLVTALKSGTAVSAVAVAATATSAVITGLAGGTAYTFQIQALNEYGAGTAATAAAVTPTGPASTYVSMVLSSSPSVFYRLADSDPGAMADSSGHGATGAYTAQSTLGQAGPLGNDPATSIGDNAQGPAAGGYPSLPLFAQPRTLEGWINTTDAGQDVLAGYGTQAVSEGFSVAIQPHLVIVSGFNDDLSFTSATALDDANWHFLAVTTTGTSATVYVDGISLGTQAFTTPLNTLASPGGLQIGAGAQSCCGNFNGKLADVAVFPSALTVAKITAQFAASGFARPAAPGSPTATAGANQATVSWQAPPGANPAVTGYLVTARKGSTAVNAVSVAASATSAIVTGLAGGTAYTFQIQALNEYGAGTAATAAAVTPTGPASTYVSTILSSSPSVFYRLADTDPGAMADSSGHGATGNYAARTTLGETGPLANDPATAVGDDSTGPAGAGNPSLPLFAQPRTLEIWASSTSVSQEYLVGYGTNATGEAFSVSDHPHDVIVSGFNDDLTFTSAASLDDGSWHFVVVTTTSSSATVYVDGISLGTQNFPDPLDTVAASQGLLVGALAQDCCGTSFSGDLADMAVFPAALTASQVTAQFAASGLGRPLAPGSPGATTGASQAAVAWQAPPGADPAVTGYLVTALKGGTAVNAVSVPASATSTSVTGLAGGTAYTFQIQALNEYGAGTAATAAAVTPTGPASTYVSTILSSKPSVFYRLGDTDRGALADSSGHGATGGYTAQTTLGAAGPLGNDPATGISDNGNSPAASGNPSLPLYAQPRTLEGWINTTNGGDNFLAGYGTQTTAGGFEVKVQPHDVFVSSFADDLTFTTASTLDDGSWHFVVVTTNGTSATVYVDGASLGTHRFRLTLNTLAASQGLAIGAGTQGCCGFFDGDLADVAVFPAALTASQVTAQFAASGLAPPPAPGSPAATAGANQATVSWQAPAGSDPAVTGYLVTAVNGSSAGNAVSVAASATSAVVTGLAGGTAYTFRIQAVNEYGAGAVATTAAVTPTGATSTYASTVLASNPTAFYRLADTAPSAMADSSGNGATGIYTAQSTLGVTGPLANDPATGIGDNANGPAASSDPSLPLFAHPRTLEGWVNTTNGGENFLASYGAQVTGEGFALAVEPNAVIVSGFSDDLSFPASSALDDGSWHFVVVTATGSSATVYVDGTSLGSQSFPSSLDTVPPALGLQVGTGVQGCCGNFNGDLADLAVFPAALTAAQVSAQYVASGDTAGRRSSHPGDPAHAARVTHSRATPLRPQSRTAPQP